PTPASFTTRAPAARAPSLQRTRSTSARSGGPTSSSTSTTTPTSIRTGRSTSASRRTRCTEYRNPVLAATSSASGAHASEHDLDDLGGNGGVEREAGDQQAHVERSDEEVGDHVEIDAGADVAAALGRLQRAQDGGAARRHQI